MDNQYKFVDFEKYCKTCKYKETKEVLDPCNECLSNPVNENSMKPVCYKEAEK